MEILKGFEFQLQRFAGLDISGITEPATMAKASSFEVIEDGAGGYKLAAAGTLNSVLTIGLWKAYSGITDIIRSYR